MLGYALRRLLASIPVLFVLSVVSFAATRAISSPEAGIRSNPRVSAEDVQRYREQLGLDDSAVTQYLRWLGSVLRGDLGTSLVSNRDVAPQLADALWNTMVLGVTAVVISFVIGITIGVVAAVRRGSAFDHLSTGAAFFGLSMPNFWFAIMLQLVFGVYLVEWLGLDGPIFYTAGMRSPGSDFDLVDRIRHLVLPATVLAVQLVAVYSRYMRASMVEVLRADYVRTARAFGVRESRVVRHHASRNALVPVTTQLAGDIGAIFGGLVVTETVFQWPGMGPLFLDAIQSGDYQVILPWLMITSLAVVVFNLAADLAYGVLDPRVRLG